MTAPRRELTSYETGQVHRIAGWKAESPGFIPGLIEKVTHPLVKLAEKAISKEAVAEAIEKAYIESELFIHQERIAQRAGVTDIRELREGELARCDQLADEFARLVAEKGLVAGALIGGGGPLATMLYVKSQITQTLRMIHTMGLCYGYGTDEPHEHDYALGVLLISSASSREERQHALVNLGKVEDLIFEEAFEELIEEAVTETVIEQGGLSIVPALGMLVGAVETAEIIEHAAAVAKMCFQERWLRGNGLIEGIEPDATYARSTMGRIASTVGQTVYWAAFGISYTLTFPVVLVRSFLPTDNIAGRGFADGTKDACRDVERLRAVAPAPRDLSAAVVTAASS